MKVLIMGAGGQGGPCASILSRDNAVDEIRLADLDLAIADKVADKIGSSKIKTLQVNAVSVGEVAKAADSVDVIIDLVMPWMAKYVMEAALKVKSNYVNSAFDTPFGEELSAGNGPSQIPSARNWFPATPTKSLILCRETSGND